MSAWRDGIAPAAGLVALVGGILAGERAGPADATPLLLAGVVGLLVAWFVRGGARPVLAAVALVLLGSAVSQRAVDGLVHSPLAPLVATGAVVECEGDVVRDPRGARYRAEAVTRLARCRTPTGDTRDAGGRHVVVVATGADAGRFRLLVAGDAVSVRGRLDPLSPFRRHLRSEHVGAELVDAQLRGFDGPRDPLMRVADRLRHWVLRGTDALPPTEHALLAGYLLGDTRGVPVAVIDDYRASGLSHLLAVSGANVAFVLALAGPLLRRLAIGGRLVGGLFVVVVFGAMTRFEPSVLRASALAAAVMLASFTGREAAPLRLLLLAVASLLLVDPFLVHVTAFQLSCAASAGIVVLAPGLARRLRGPRAIRDALSVSLAAQIGVAPVLVPVFGSMPAIAPIANLLAAPVAEPITVIGFAAGSLGALVGGPAPAVERLAVVPLDVLLAVVGGVARAGAAVPLTVDGSGLLALVAVLATVAAVRRGASRVGGSLRADARRALPDTAAR